MCTGDSKKVPLKILKKGKGYLQKLVLNFKLQPISKSFKKNSILTHIEKKLHAC